MQSSSEHFGEVVRELKQRCNLKCAALVLPTLASVCCAGSVLLKVGMHCGAGCMNVCTAIRTKASFATVRRYVLCWHAMMGYWSGCMPGVSCAAQLCVC